MQSPDDPALEGQFRVLLDTIPTLAWRTSADGRAEFFNRRWLEYAGLSADEARGWEWTSALHPDDQDHLIQTWQTILQSGQPGEAEARLKGADGRYRWFLFRCVPLRDEEGRITGWCGTNTDIEDRKRIEDDLCRSKAILEETQRITRCGSMGLNISTGEVFWSAEAARIFGFAPQDRPTVEQILQVLHPDDRWLCERSVGRTLRGEPDTDYDVRLVMADGSIRIVRRIDSPGESKSPSSLGSVCAVIDVTEAREAEAALQETQADLARITRVTTLGEMAASITHEVLQPISAIVANGEAALQWLLRPKPEIDEVREALESMVADGHRAAAIVNGIRSLAKKSKPERLVFDLNRMLEDAVALIRGELVRDQVSLRLELESGLPGVRSDRVQLQQVVINLLINGIQAMSGLATTRVLSLRSKRYGEDQVIVEVEDRGAGIDAEVGDRVFAPFVTTKPDGMGMGLAICRSIVAAHGGRLWFTRAEVGTIFHFSLPLALLIAGI
jgi:PAS domain S-box-containing protein